MSYELSRTIAFLERPDSYGPFDVIGNNRISFGCIDPRDEEAAGLLVKMQAAGGAIGEGLDVRMAHSVAYPDERPLTIEEGMNRDRCARPELLFGAHEGCKFALGLAAVAAEMGNPSDRTLAGLHQRARRLHLIDAIGHRILGQVRRAASAFAEDTIPDEEHLLAAVQREYPGEPSIVTMKGQANPKVWVRNYSYLGLRRQALHREQSLPVHAYHESTGATTRDLLVRHGEPHVQHARVVAHLLRAAAVETILTHDGIVGLDVTMAADGLQTQLRI